MGVNATCAKCNAPLVLEHSNICNVHEIDGTDDGQMFIAMAYYEGETLKSKDRARAKEKTIRPPLQN